MKIGDSPKVVCLCGSIRFAEEMNRVARDYTMQGWIVVRPEVVTYLRQEDPQKTDRLTKARLDVLHLAKIDLADLVYVVNRGGYVGESTEREVEYARMRGKEMKFMEEICQAVCAVVPGMIGIGCGLPPGHEAGHESKDRKVRW